MLTSRRGYNRNNQGFQCHQTGAPITECAYKREGL